MDDNELQRATDAILFPETHSTDTVELSLCLSPDAPEERTVHRIRLRQLPIKHAKILAGFVRRIEQAQSESPLTQLDSVADLLVDVATHLLSFYGIKHCSRDVIESSLSFEEVYEFVHRQMVVQREGDFLLVGLRGILRIVRDMIANLDQAIGRQTTVLSQSPPSTPPSVASGGSVLMN